MATRKTPSEAAAESKAAAEPKATAAAQKAATAPGAAAQKAGPAPDAAGPKAAAPQEATPDAAAETEALPAPQDVIVQGIVPVAQRDLTLMYEVGYLYIELGRFTEAEDVFTGVASLVPESEVPFIALGHLAFSQGHYNPALRHHQRAAEINPNSAAAHAAVAEALFFLKKPRAALDALRRAMELEPEGPVFAFASALKDAYEQGLFVQDIAV